MNQLRNSMRGSNLKDCFLLLILIFEYACIGNNQTVDNQADIVNVDSSESSNQVDLEMKKMEGDIENEKRNFKINLQKKTYNFVCYDKCDDSQPETLFNPDDLKKYGRRKLYKISKSVVNDSLIIRFSFIDDCCLEYIGDVDKKGDTLKLAFKNIRYLPCDCYCDYNYQYSLPISKYQSRFILLRDSLIQR
jgi:hypothetical protein